MISIRTTPSALLRPLGTVLLTLNGEYSSTNEINGQTGSMITVRPNGHVIIDRIEWTWDRISESAHFSGKTQQVFSSYEGTNLRYTEVPKTTDIYCNVHLNYEEAQLESSFMGMLW